MSTEQVRKRIVLHHSTGKFAGLYRICGLLEGLAHEVSAAVKPSFDYKEDGVEKKALHRKTTTRHIEYHEWAALPSGRFGDDLNPMQR